jgi:hypothetical protein
MSNTELYIFIGSGMGFGLIAVCVPVISTGMFMLAFACVLLAIVFNEANKELRKP